MYIVFCILEQIRGEVGGNLGIQVLELQITQHMVNKHHKVKPIHHTSHLSPPNTELFAL